MNAMDQRRHLQVLAINSGSSSLKVSLYRMAETEQALLTIEARRIGIQGGRMTAVNGQGETIIDREIALPNHAAALNRTLEWVREQNMAIDAAGHRVVHGGNRYTDPQIITDEVISGLRDLISIDPDHLPQSISAIEAVKKEHPSLPQVACFDTAFHRQMPRVAQICPLPARFYEEGIQRYGFHGLSYEYVMSEMRRMDAEEAEGRIVIAHLGNGASMAAIHHGKSQETSMGFTPMAGLPMGTRCGDIDPGVLLYLMENKKMTVKAVSDLLNKESGLLGVSGSSADMQDLLEREKGDPRAALAIELFCRRVKEYLGAYAAALGGLDLVVFTGGIGQHSPQVRERVCAGLEFLGIALDLPANRENEGVISVRRSPVKVRVIKTNEEVMVGRHTARLLEPQPAGENR
jgi:acetate kinase